MKIFISGIAGFLGSHIADAMLAKGHEVIGCDNLIGGEKDNVPDGAEFYAAITFDTSMQARIAEAQGVKNLYTVTTRKAMNLQYHDVFRRAEDGKVFRVTSDGDDNKTPATAGLNMRQVTAEEYEIPREVANG